MSRSRASWLLLLAAVLGCARGGSPEPRLLEVLPSVVRPDAPTGVSIHGRGFSARIRADLDEPSRSEIDARFEVALLQGEQRVQLTDVALVSGAELSAVVPAGLALGTYDLELTDPRGRRAHLEGALGVAAPECAGRSGAVCIIDGQCVPDGTARPGVPCQRCRSAVAADAWSPAPDGAPCEDGDACTTGETCSAGACERPTGHLACPPDACHPGGSCDPARGCPVFVDGTPCEDGSACTKGETCQQGHCAEPASVVTCEATACALEGSCDPLSGRCVRAPRADGSPCDDGVACTGPDRCQAGACRGAARCGNTAPTACLKVTPTVDRSTAVFGFDASCSTDAEDTALEVRFDFDGDGTFDTPFGAVRTAAHVYAAPGLFEAAVEVRDSAGLSSFASRVVRAVPASSEVLVTTGVDEADPGASPSRPGGSGLSLREAILYVNALGLARVIRIPANLSLKAKELPPLRPQGTEIVAAAGARLDFSAATAGASCLTLDGPDQWLLGLEAGGCPGPLVVAKADRARIAESRLRGAAGGSGVQVSGTAAWIGPRTELSHFPADALVLRGPRALVGLCRIHDNAEEGVRVHPQGESARLVQNLIYANGGPGVLLQKAQPAAVVLFNTIDGNGGDGVVASGNPSGLQVKNNLITFNGGAGIAGPSGAFADREPNGLFGNQGGPFSSGAPGSRSVLAEPRYLARGLSDFRLEPTSPEVNAGEDVGLDVNGPGLGDFHGSAPDLGALESPY